MANETPAGNRERSRAGNSLSGRPANPSAEVATVACTAGSGEATHTAGAFPRCVRVSLDTNRWRRPGGSGRRKGTAGKGPRARYKPDNSRKAECVQTDDVIREGRDVVVDNTDLAGRIRRPYIALARKHRVHTQPPCPHRHGFSRCRHSPCLETRRG